MIEGRGGDDIIDGDRWLERRTRKSGPGRYPGMTTALRSAVAGGHDQPRIISIFRSIVTPPPAPANVDAAVFSDVRANYDITENDDGSVTVEPRPWHGHRRHRHLWNIERLRFTDGSVELRNIGQHRCHRTATISDTSPDGGPGAHGHGVNIPTPTDSAPSSSWQSTWESRLDGEWTRVQRRGRCHHVHSFGRRGRLAAAGRRDLPRPLWVRPSR